MTIEMAKSDSIPITRKTHRPIILLGNGGSGTSLLGQIFAQHPDVAYWGEPTSIWMHRHAYQQHHELRAEDLTPKIARFIDQRFARFLDRSDRSRLATKTPSNCLQIPFILALYPDCRIINIIRDGRNVVGSTLKGQSSRPNIARIKARLVETPLWEWPAYLRLWYENVWKRLLLGRPSTYRGVKPVGWKAWIGLPMHIIAAKQWKHVVEMSIRDGRALHPENYIEIRYERLVEEPARVVSELTAFAGLPPSEEMISYAVSSIDPSRVGNGILRLTVDQMREAVAEMEPLLSQLGYGD